MPRIKTSRQMERHFKGIANHWRIEILILVSKRDGIALEEIVGEIGGNFKTISEHTRRLVQAGLVNKSYKGRYVMHTLSPYGRNIAKLLTTFQHS